MRNAEIALGIIQFWVQVMAARKRKTLVTCEQCHDDIHAGRLSNRSPRME